VHLFSHRDHGAEHGPIPDDAPVPVDRDLVRAMEDVEGAVDAYLTTTDPLTRSSLIDCLAGLDELVEAGDGFAGSNTVRGGAYGMALGTAPLGARSLTPIVDVVPEVVLRALVDLVRRAKEDVGAPGPPSTALRDAAARVAAARASHPAVASGQDGGEPPTVPGLVGGPPTPPPPLRPPPPQQPPSPGLP